MEQFATTIDVSLEAAQAGVQAEEGPESRVRNRDHASTQPSLGTSANGQVANYAEFHGAEGRDVYFRPDRYQLSDLGPIGVAVEFLHKDEIYRCNLCDVSQNGVAFEWPAQLPVEVGSMLARMIVRFDEHEAYHGQAKVSSIRRGDGKTIVGVSFVETLMNIEDVLHLRDVKALTGGGSAKGLGLSDAPWKVPGQERFKARVSEMRLLLEDGERKLTELEASLPWNVVHGDQHSPARDALVQRIRSEFMSGVLELSNEIDAALRLSPRADRDALREYSRRFLHGYLMQSPWVHRAHHKPLGYPGDYEVMNGLYGNHFSGSNLFAKAVNLCFVSTPAAVAVRARKDMIKRRLSALIDSAAPGSKLRILSIAAGPAQEIFELLQERTHIPCALEIVLFDQDRRALSFSYGRLKRLVGSRWQSEVTLLHLHDSIKRLLRGATVFSGQGVFDAIYSCGLFDYLQLPTAVSLCTSLYALLAPRGTLYIGNMVPSCQSRWIMELHLDWFLVYRERSEMLELARVAAPDALIEIVEEDTGVDPFVALTRE